jgi:uncharacterized protein YqgC (DUF456 family)
MDLQGIAGVALVLAGIAGSVIPVFPGPILAFSGLVFLFFSRNADGVTAAHLAVFGLLVVILTIASYVVPILGARLAGSTRRGVVGAVIGTLLGTVFFPPMGMFVGALLGAVIGEYAVKGQVDQAARAGLGVVVGGLAVIAAEVLFSMAAAVYFALHCSFS